MFFIKRFYFLLLLPLHLIIYNHSLNAEIQTLPAQADVFYETALNTNLKLPIPDWKYQFLDEENLYQDPIMTVNCYSKNDLIERYERMVHVPFVDVEQKHLILERLYQLSTLTDDLADYIKKRISTPIIVQNISVYGSFLYNPIDPDDIDLLVIVDAPHPVGHHFDTTFEQILGLKTDLPKVSIQIMDYNTYIKVKSIADRRLLNSPENMALQQLAIAGSWYLTLYGYEIRHDDLNTLQEHTLVNYLNKTTLVMNAAGARLFKSAYRYLKPESDLIRLRKVLSRILIGDFLLVVLDPSSRPNIEIYADLYQELREIENSGFNNFSDIECKIECLYYEKLKELFAIAFRMHKLDNISLSQEG